LTQIWIFELLDVRLSELQAYNEKPTVFSEPKFSHPLKFIKKSVSVQKNRNWWKKSKLVKKIEIGKTIEIGKKKSKYVKKSQLVKNRNW